MLSIAPSTVFAPAAPEGEAGSPVLAAAVPLALAGVALAAGRIQRRPSLMVLAASFGALAASSCASLLAVDLAEGTARLLARTLGAALAFAHLGWLLLAAHGDPSGRPGHARRAAAIGAGAALAAAFVARAGMAPAAGAVPGWSTPLLAVPAALAYLAAGAMPLRTRRAGTARWLVAAGTALFAGAALASWLYPAGARAMQLAGLDALAAAAVVLGMLMAFLEDERAQAAAAAEALQNSHSQRLHSSKMEALGRMAGGVSHDFNNLLTAMRGHLELALERTLPADPRRVDLEQAWRAAERASELTRQLLSFSRARRVGANDCCDAVAVLREAEPLLHQLVGPSITIVTDLPSWAPPAAIDRTGLEQIVFNLAANARDAMPHGGTLTLRVRAGSDPARGTGTIVIEVADTGTGMDDATRARIFDPFFTTKPPGLGTGLGLAQVYGMVQQAHGQIDCVSQLGRGTTFTIVLPVRDASVPRPEPAAEPPPPTLMVGESRDQVILLVDDDALVRQLLCRSLREHGYTVIDTDDPLEALALEAGFDEPIDLLVTDVAMPKLSGNELASRFAARRPAARILFISGHPASPSAGAPHGELLQKPFSQSELLTRVERLLKTKPTPPRVLR